jgi:hypothetical protein
MNENVLAGTAALTSARSFDRVDELDASVAKSAVAWSAILAGAAAAAALSLILLILGVGLGLSAVSPWSGHWMTASNLGVSTIVWLTFTQLAASGMGGYLAGRLRTRWPSTHTDEVYFRDTAHGFLAWALATLATAAMLTSAIGSIVNGGVQAGAAVAGGAASTATAAVQTAATGKVDGTGGAASYFIDTLFRKDDAEGAAAKGTDSTAAGSSEDSAKSSVEVARIFANAISSGSVSAEDTKYVAQLVSQRTGLAQADAEKRVSDTFARMQAKATETETAARDASDRARKASAYASLWLFVSLLAGAFVASLAATYGGRRRDLY